MCFARKKIACENCVGISGSAHFINLSCPNKYNYWNDNSSIKVDNKKNVFRMELDLRYQQKQKRYFNMFIWTKFIDCFTQKTSDFHWERINTLKSIKIPGKESKHKYWYPAFCLYVGQSVKIKFDDIYNPLCLS